MLTLFLSARVPPSTRNWIVGQVACSHRAAIPRLAVPEERSAGAQKSSAATQVTCSHQSQRPRTHNRLTLPFPANLGLKRPFMSQRNEEAHRCHSSSGFSHLHDVSGSVRMVDVSTKRSGLRTAVAEAKVFVSPEICDRWKVDSNNVSLEQSSGEGSSVRGVGTNAETSSRQIVSVPACRSVALRSPKGDIFEIAKVAGIMAAKRTSSLIPLCHNLPLLAVEISLTLNESEPITVETIPATEEEHALRSPADDDNSTKPTSRVQRARVRSRPYVLIRSLVKTHSATGVEMEALTAVTIAGLTVYDMCKSVDKNITLTGVRLVSKRGGKSDFGPLP